MKKLDKNFVCKKLCQILFYLDKMSLKPEKVIHTHSQQIKDQAIVPSKVKMFQQRDDTTAACAHSVN